MIVTYGDLVDRVQSLLDDPTGDEYDENILLPHANRAQDILVRSMLDNPNIGRTKGFVTLVGIAAGVTSLANYFVDGQPLRNLSSIITMKERDADDTTTEFSLMRPAVDSSAVNLSTANRFYSFRGRDILLPGADQAKDFRIFGTFDPQPFVDGDSVLVPGTGLIIEFLTAAYAARAKGKRDLYIDYKNDAARAEEDLFTILIQEVQASPTRMRSFSGRR